MRREPVVLLVFSLAVAAGVGLVAYDLGLVEYPGEGGHDRATVTLLDESGTLATVDAEVADTRKERVRGLSEAESLEPGSGMLFVHPREGTHTYVVDEMAFGIDIIFVETCDDACPPEADGRITEIHEAPVPSDGEDGSYEGSGKWVLEVPKGYAAENGVQSGDYVQIEYLE